MDTKKHIVLITGAAGYVGTMLVEKFAARSDVARIIGVDKEPQPEVLTKQSKLTYIEANTADDWQSRVDEVPDIVIHTAWQIREIYGNRKLEWKWNIEGSDAVFDFAFTNKEVDRLIYFSTVASYGAYPDNSIDHRYTEDEPFRKMDYLYSEEKRIAETHLHVKYEEAKTAATQEKHVPTVAIVRPAAITGPRGRYMRIRFGLQAALAGQLQDNFAYRLISKMVSFVPVTPKWCRQFIHEDDVVGIIERLAFGTSLGEGAYEVFNICPPGPIVLGKNMAHAVGKRTIPVQPWMVRIPFFFMWNATRGKIPTGPGAWKSYSYPIAVDGSKVTRVLGYEYKYGSLDAFYYTNGEYESFVPASDIRHKS